MYSVLQYGHMVADNVRMDAYARAIARAVKPGSVVLDIGAGTGIFSLLAVRAGARAVHAVDPNPAIWALADLARENGVADRIFIHHTTSYELKLEEKADVIIADLRGTLPMHDANIAVLADAKARFLARAGVLIPTCDDLSVSVFESDDMAIALERGTIGYGRYGWKSDSTRRLILNTPIADGGGLRSSDLLTSSARWGKVTYGSPLGPIDGSVELVAHRAGLAHGLALWFTATLLDDIGFTNEPGSRLVYSRLVLPFEVPIKLSHRDVVKVVLRVDERGERWAWDTTVTSEGGELRTRTRQASFFGKPTSPEALLRSASSFSPTLNSQGRRLHSALALMDGNRDVTSIANAVASEHEGVPTSTVLDEVRDLAIRYGR